VFGADFELALAANIWSRCYGNYDDTAFGDINLTTGWLESRSGTFATRCFRGVAARPFIDKAVGNRTQTNIEAF